MERYRNDLISNDNPALSWSIWVKYQKIKIAGGLRRFEKGIPEHEEVNREYLIVSRDARKLAAKIWYLREQ